MKTRTLLEKYKAIQKIGFEIEVPFEIWRCMGTNMKKISIMGSDICLGEDFVSVEQAREALDWYVSQLGGKVEWKD